MKWFLEKLYMNIKTEDKVPKYNLFDKRVKLHILYKEKLKGLFLI